MRGSALAVILGNITRDGVVREVGDKTVCKFSVAVNGRKDGDVSYFDCSMWNPGGTAEFLVKGKSVQVTGDLMTERWETDGVRKEKTVINNCKVTLLGSSGKPTEEKEKERAW